MAFTAEQIQNEQKRRSILAEIQRRQETTADRPVLTSQDVLSRTDFGAPQDRFQTPTVADPSGAPQEARQAAIDELDRRATTPEQNRIEGFKPDFQAAQQFIESGASFQDAFQPPTVADPSAPPAIEAPRPQEIGAAPERGFFEGGRSPLPPDATRLEKADRAFDLAVGTPLRVFLKFSQGKTLNMPDLLWAGLKKITPDSIWESDVKKMTLEQAMDWAAGNDPSGFEKMIGSFAEFGGRLSTAKGIGTKTGILGKTLPKSATVLDKAFETAKLFGLGGMTQQLQKLISQEIDPETDHQYEGAIAVVTDMGLGAGISIGNSLIVKPAFSAVARSPIGTAIIESYDRAMIEFTKNFPVLADSIRKNPSKEVSKMVDKQFKARGIDPAKFNTEQNAVSNHLGRELEKRIIKARRNFKPAEDIIKRKIKPKLITGQPPKPVQIAPTEAAQPPATEVKPVQEPAKPKEAIVTPPKAAEAKPEGLKGKTFSEQVEELKKLDLTDQEFGQRVAAIKTEPTKAAEAVPEERGIGKLVSDFEDGKIETIDDLVDEVEAVAEDTPQLQDAVDKFRADAREDVEKLGLRGDVEAREETFLAEIKKPTPTAKPKVQPEGLPEIDRSKLPADVEIKVEKFQAKEASPEGSAFALPAQPATERLSVASENLTVEQVRDLQDQGFVKMSRENRFVSPEIPQAQPTPTPTQVAKAEEPTVKPKEAKPITAETKQAQPKAVQGEPVTKKVVNEVEDAIKTDVTAPAFPTSTKHAATKETRERLGIGQVNSKTRRSDEQAMSEAIEQKIPEKALRIAEEINETSRALSDTEDAGMRIKVAELEIEHEQIMKLIGESKDAADTKTLSTEANRVEAEFDSILSALETSGSEAGRALRARRVQIGKDFKLVAVLNRAKSAAGKKISAAKTQLFKQLTEKLAKTDKRVEVLQSEVAELKASKAVQRGSRRFTTMNRQQRQTSRKTLADKLNVLLQEGCAN